MLKQLSDGWTQGLHILYHDEGKVSPGSITNKFAVTDREKGTLLGYIKWYVLWRKYVFHPLNCILDSVCLHELAEFCELNSTEHRKRWEANRPKEYKRNRFLQKKLEFPKEE